ncbi:transglutaminase-like domain-containing protein [Ramlibacter sp. MMS24-I3-19]|uniref:transglutaminase-like domain-containing protein n=1 Tax=Ramlibacter sp. MMS24-I3-19 TaxID=3416606 RepID=UPI003D092EF8
MMQVSGGGAKPRAGPEMDAPGRWLVSTALLDLEDPRLAIRATSLTQLAATDRAKALAIYGFVKRMPYRRQFKMNHRRAREVLDSGWGDGPDKATLMVALLRSVGVPARLRMVRMDGRIMRGLVDRLDAISWPFVEVWLDDRWIRTDTYIFDAGYMAAAREALRKSGQRYGFGVYVDSQPLWSGLEDTSLSPLPPGEDPMLLEDMGPFHDHREYMASSGFRARHSRRFRFLRWNLLVPAMRLAIQRLRG